MSHMMSLRITTTFLTGLGRSQVTNHKAPIHSHHASRNTQHAKIWSMASLVLHRSKDVCVGKVDRRADVWSFNTSYGSSLSIPNIHFAVPSSTSLLIKNWWLVSCVLIVCKWQWQSVWFRMHGSYSVQLGLTSSFAVRLMTRCCVFIRPVCFQAKVCNIAPYDCLMDSRNCCYSRMRTYDAC